MVGNGLRYGERWGDVKQIVLDAPEEVGPWVANRTGAVWTRGRGTAIGLFSDEGWIAGVIYDSWNGRSLCMHVAAVPGARWMTKDYLQVCFAYPFLQLGCSKLIGLVGEGNMQARKFDEHLGFVLEATLEDAHPDGKLLVYTMTKEQCRWINAERRPHGQAFRTPAA